MSKCCTQLAFDGRGIAQIDLTADRDVYRPSALTSTLAAVIKLAAR